MSAKHLPAGEARAPGPSVADTLRSDRVPPPAALLNESCPFLGDALIPASRYTDTDFARREDVAIWAHTWQWACRAAQLPEAGDLYVYDIGPYSVVIVRDDSGSLRAFHNRCTHRGTRLIGATGGGFIQGFACPFHGWRWHLDGQLKQVPGGWDFPHVSAQTHSLNAVACETWGGFVFVNLDAAAPSLAEYMGVMNEHFDEFPLDERKVAVHALKRLPANWKAAQEAFMEAYHNFETHDSPNGGNTQYDVLDTHVSRFIHNIGAYSPASLADYPGVKWREPVLTEQQTLESLAIFAPGLGELPAGKTAREVVAGAMRESLSAALNKDMSAVSDALLLDSIEYHLFPNMFFFPGFGVPMVYRFRPDPDSVDHCLFDLLVMAPLAADEEEPYPPDPVYLEVEQSYTEVPGLGWLGTVYDEDTGNLQLQTQGLKSAPAGEGITLGNYQEVRIRHVHQLIDSYLDRYDDRY